MVHPFLFIIDEESTFTIICTKYFIAYLTDATVWYVPSCFYWILAHDRIDSVVRNADGTLGFVTEIANIFHDVISAYQRSEWLPLCLYIYISLQGLTRWSLLFRWYFHIKTILHKITCILISISLNIFTDGKIVNKSALIQVYWHPTSQQFEYLIQPQGFRHPQRCVITPYNSSGINIHLW